MRTKTAALLTQQKPPSHNKLEEQKREASSQPKESLFRRAHRNRLVSQTSEYNYISICNSEKSRSQSNQCHKALELQNLRLLESNCATLQKIEGIKQYVKTSVEQAMALMQQQQYPESFAILKQIIGNLKEEWLPEKDYWLANRVFPEAKVHLSPIKINPESAKQLAICKLVHDSHVTSEMILPMSMKAASEILESNNVWNFTNESRVIARKQKQKTPRFLNLFTQKSMSSSFCQPDFDKNLDLYLLLLAQAEVIEAILVKE